MRFCLVFVFLFSATFCQAKVLTNSFRVNYEIDTLGEDLIILQPVDGTGTVGAQSGVTYLWFLIHGTDTSKTSGATGMFWPNPDKTTTYQVCMMAHAPGDTVYTCQSITLNPSLHGKRPVTCPHVFYDDKNNNCKQDAGEALLKIPVRYKVNPYQYFYLPNSRNDTVFKTMARDTYNVISLNAAAQITCSGSLFYCDSVHENQVQSFPVKLVGSGRNFGVVIGQNSGWYPGYSGSINLYLHNSGVNGGNTTVSLMIPDSISLLSSSAKPNFTSGNEMRWSTHLDAGENKTISLQFSISHLAYTNTDSVVFVATCDSMASDADSTDNRAMCMVYLNGSYDPNFKEVLSPDALDNDSPLEYKIHFQNTGNGPAIRILVADTLPAETDPESLQVLGASHDVQTIVKNAVATFVFDNIMLPDSASNPEGSHGYVQFRIQLVKNSGGTVYATVKNKASIYFDFNAPIVTNEAIIYARVMANTQKQSGIQNTNYSMFPNPGVSDITLTRKNAGRKETIVLWDYQGRKIQEFQLSAGQNNAKLDVTQLAHGVYILRTETGAGLRFLKE